MQTPDQTFEFGADSFDSREIIARIEYLDHEAGELDEDEQEELSKLREFERSVTSGDTDWNDGMFFVRGDDFQNYAREYAEEIGAVNPEAAWPARHIDWEAAADELSQDYTPYTLDGTEYLAR